MTEYVLVGVTHHGRGVTDRSRSSFLGPESQAEFARRITPQLTAGSLVLMEGFYHKKLVHPAKPEYNELRREFGMALGSVSPVIGGYDRRAGENIGKTFAAEERGIAWDTVCSRLYLKHVVPTSLQEFVERLPEINQLEILSTPTNAEVELARWARARNRRLDEDYLEAARRFGSSHDVCAIVMGGVHIFSLAQQVPYPVEYMEPETPGMVKEMYYGYLADYVLPSRLIERSKVA